MHAATKASFFIIGLRSAASSSKASRYVSWTNLQVLQWTREMASLRVVDRGMVTTKVGTGIFTSGTDRAMDGTGFNL